MASAPAVQLTTPQRHGSSSTHVDPHRGAASCRPPGRGPVVLTLLLRLLDWAPLTCGDRGGNTVEGSGMKGSSHSGTSHDVGAARLSLASTAREGDIVLEVLDFERMTFISSVALTVILDAPDFVDRRRLVFTPTQWG